MRPLHVWRFPIVLFKCYHNNNGSESTVVETVEQTWIEHHVAEPLEIENPKIPKSTPPIAHLYGISL
jgi:hypothetical protein